MHELSIAHGIVEAVRDTLSRSPSVATVTAVGVRVGALSGVVPEALRFCFDVAAGGTPLDGARLEIEAVPVAIHCAPCDRVVDLSVVPPFRCPACLTPSADVRRGRELEVAWMAVEDGATAGREARDDALPAGRPAEPRDVARVEGP